MLQWDEVRVTSCAVPRGRVADETRKRRYAIGALASIHVDGARLFQAMRQGVEFLFRDYHMVLQQLLQSRDRLKIVPVSLTSKISWKWQLLTVTMETTGSPVAMVISGIMYPWSYLLPSSVASGLVMHTFHFGNGVSLLTWQRFVSSCGGWLVHCAGSPDCHHEWTGGLVWKCLRGKEMGQSEFAHTMRFFMMPNQRTARQILVSSPTLFYSCCSCSWTKERCPSFEVVRGAVYPHTVRWKKRERGERDVTIILPTWLAWLPCTQTDEMHLPSSHLPSLA